MDGLGVGKFFLGGSHADDLLYLFNLNLPIVLCDLQTFLVGLSTAWLQCVLEVGILEATNCVTDPQGKFKQDYGECIFGSLTEAEAKTSDAMVRAWTNFAIYGYVKKSHNFFLKSNFDHICKVV